jgi:hypothetical protein
MTGERFLPEPQPKFRGPVVWLTGDALGLFVAEALRMPRVDDRIRDS